MNQQKKLKGLRRFLTQGLLTASILTAFFLPLTASAATVITGEVVDSDGDGIAGITVTAYLDGSPVKIATTDAAAATLGDYKIEGLDATKEYQLHYSGAGYLETWYLNAPYQDCAVPVKPSAVEKVVLSEDPSPKKGKISGTVTEKDSNPVKNIAGATVTVTNADESVTKTATTSATGAYAVINLPTSADGIVYTVTFSKEDYRDVTFTEVTLKDAAADAEKTQDAVLVKKDIGKISGTVKNNATPSVAIAGVTVTTDGKTATTDAAGTYTIDDLAADANYTVEFAGHAVGYENGTVNVVTINADGTIAANSADTTLVKLAGTDGKISGKVTDTTPANIAGATVTVTGGGVTKTAITSAIGDYEVTGLPYSTTDDVEYTVSVAGKSEKAILLTNAPHAAVVDFVLPLGTISGTVTVTDSDPVQNINGVTVVVSKKSGEGEAATWDVVQSTTTGTNGTYTVLGLEVAVYKVEFTLCGVTQSSEVEVTVAAPAATADKSFGFAQCGEKISGVVTKDKAGYGCVDVQVDGSSHTTRTNHAGLYTLGNVPATGNIVSFARDSDEQWYLCKADAASADLVDAGRNDIDACFTASGTFCGCGGGSGSTVQTIITPLLLNNK